MIFHMTRRGEAMHIAGRWGDVLRPVFVCLSLSLSVGRITEKVMGRCLWNSDNV